MPRFLPYSLVSRVLGLLLLAAAVLKLNGLAIEPVARTGVFSLPEFQLGLVEIECALATWLLWGISPVASWLSCSLAFALFAAASFYQGWIGQASCGCFGRLSVNPWITFSGDLIALAALVVSRPDLKALWQNPRSAWSQLAVPALTGLAALSLLFGGLAALIVYGFGSTEAALVYFREETVTIYPRLIYLGEGDPGEVQKGIVQVKNWTDHPIRVFGGTSDCSCVATDDLPLTIGPGEATPISVTVHLPSGEGMFTRTAVLLTDDPGARRVRFQVSARIARPNSDSDN
jgi:hypothetical protein